MRQTMTIARQADRQYRRMLDSIIAKAGSGKLTHMQIACDKARQQPTARKLEAARIAVMEFLKSTALTKDEWAVVAEDPYYNLCWSSVDQHPLAKPDSAYVFAANLTGR
jgi:hypothetical protein